MWVLKLVVGSKLGRIAALALAVILIFSLMILWLVNTTETRVLQEVELETLRQEIETRNIVDEAVRNSPRSHDDAVEFLRERQSGKRGGPM